MQNILEYTFKELKDEFASRQIPPNRAYPIFGWIYRKSTFDFETMSDLPKDLRKQFAEDYEIVPLREETRIESPDGEAVKFLFRTNDDKFIESVLLVSEKNDDPEDPQGRLTVCVSSQVGCALRCQFCATGMLGYARDLSTAEIIAQVLLVDKFAKERFGSDDKGRVLSNVVFMGMGEPMMNLDNVLKTIHTLNFSGGFNLGMRHMTISTAGIVPGIKELAERNNQVRLAISLNSANQEKRKTVMPITRKYGVTELLEAVRFYQDETNRRVTFEYVLLKGINDEETDVIAMKRALMGFKYNLNLIVYNPVETLPFEKPDHKTVKKFMGYLDKHGISYVTRYSKGAEIAAGCGQLGLTTLQNM
jgi:23S rRNA (adenine2503-C2)-methyltransferase